FFAAAFFFATGAFLLEGFLVVVFFTTAFLFATFFEVADRLVGDLAVVFFAVFFRAGALAFDFTVSVLDRRAA
ncbi:MAG: hypothetical protein CMO26_14860, partial [Thiotrichales bacterium]|nr:hypothetical protein [Thiotrichales bacterium]